MDQYVTSAVHKSKTKSILCTDDVFKSTVHRAANRSGAERYSIPLFFGVDYDVLLEVGRQVTFPHPVALKDLLANRQLRKCRAATTV
jgi:isopenicillin N synthase-like dioxygenase